MGENLFFSDLRVKCMVILFKVGDNKIGDSLGEKNEFIVRL